MTSKTGQLSSRVRSGNGRLPAVRLLHQPRNWRTEVHAVAVPLVLDDGTIMGFSCSGASFQLSRQLIESDIGPRLINLVGNVRTALSFARN
ncbi:hypothetical protein [Geotalea toluenoxydans]|uniref:hypothetical protein n=1 Tax=Geotalea toluenoxydans TaxID=421624 RepID=UPI0006CFDE6C|nr:hypothetical protein [Geotalea toluenoxydans]